MDAVFQELEKIRTRHGVLKPRHVVEAARDPDSPLHDKFEWDDTRAGQEYRLWQARRLIRTYVIIDGKPQYCPGTRLPMQDRAYVSLIIDQVQKDGGYRRIEDVLADPDQRAMLLERAEADFRYWEAKYQHLIELSGVIEEMNKVRKGMKKSKKLDARRSQIEVEVS